MAAVDESLSPPIVATPARELAARALHAGPHCSQQQISEVLGVSRRTIGRMAEADLSTALRNPQVLEAARTCLAETATRGLTTEERDAAVAWLENAARDEHQVEVKRAVTKPLTSTTSKPTARVPPRRPHRTNGVATCTPDPASAPLEVDALRRQQQRILHRAALVDYVLAAERRGGDPLTMGDALAELLADITDAARTIGALLPTANGRP